MAAVTRTATEWLLVDMAAASVHRYAGAQFSRAGRGGIYLHEKTPKTVFATDALSTSETIRVSGNIRIGARDALMVDMAAASVNRYADAQLSRAWRNVGLYFHSAHSVSSFAWDSLHTSETTDTGAIRRSAFESLRIDEAAVTVRRYADAQFSSGWRNPGIYIHGLGPNRSCAQSLVITQSVSRTLVTGRFATESLTISESAQITPHGVTTDTLTISESATAGSARLRSTTDAPSVSDSANRTGVFKRSCAESPGIVESATPHEGLMLSESLVVSDSARRIAALHRSASDVLSTSESAAASVAAHAIVRSANDAISTSENATGAATAHFVRTVSESLSIAESAIRLVNQQRSSNEALTITLVAFLRETLSRNTAEFPAILEEATKRKETGFYANEFLALYQFAQWRFGYGDPWEYILDLRTGNFPAVSGLITGKAESIASAPQAGSELVSPQAGSELDVPEAGSDLTIPQTESVVSAPQAGSELVSPEAGSELDAPEAESELSGNVADSGLRYIVP